MSTFLLSYFPTFPAFSLEVSKNTHGAMHMELKELLDREVDLVVEGTLRPYAAENANRDKKLIYERAA